MSVIKGQIGLGFLLLLVVAACKELPKEKLSKSISRESGVAPWTADSIEDAVIYEANIRQYSAEGTFKAFTQDIPQLKELGIKIIWLMPVFPISTTNSKGPLGSYYAVSDYTGINPEYGTLEDFRNLVQTAHDNGMYVILDWVANHTGWDHKWLEQHPEWYTQDENGRPTHPIGTDWTDTADLNYDQDSMRKAMAEAMTYWVREEGVDGFRCDMAGMVPLDFWKPTIASLRKHKPLFMLAEAWEPQLLDTGFDMLYAWETHHIMNRIAKGENTVGDWDHRMQEVDSLYPNPGVLLNFTSNHDENSWAGTVFERLGPGAELMAALSYCAPGTPLIYSGQEYDLDKRLRFFEKDTIDKERGDFWGVYQKLGRLKIGNTALRGGDNSALYTRIPNSDDIDVLTFERKNGDEALYFLGNLSAGKKSFYIPLYGRFWNVMTGTEMELPRDEKVVMEPWEYLILSPVPAE